MDHTGKTLHAIRSRVAVLIAPEFQKVMFPRFSGVGLLDDHPSANPRRTMYPGVTRRSSGRKVLDLVAAGRPGEVTGPGGRRSGRTPPTGRSRSRQWRTTVILAWSRPARPLISISVARTEPLVLTRAASHSAIDPRPAPASQHQQPAASAS